MQIKAVREMGIPPLNATFSAAEQEHTNAIILGALRRSQQVMRFSVQ